MSDEQPKKEWLTMAFAQSQIMAKSEKSVKIAFPSGSRYKDYSFWISKKLFKDDYFILGSDFVVKARKEKCVDGKFEVEDEQEFGAAFVKHIFSKFAESEVEQVIEIKPAYLAPIENPQPLEELMR